MANQPWLGRCRQHMREIALTVSAVTGLELVLTLWTNQTADLILGVQHLAHVVSLALR
jgi:hypothetical protein